MKILIKEDRLQTLINTILDETFGDLYETKDYITDYRGEHWEIRYSKDGQVVMLYLSQGKLYVAEEMVSKLNMFGFERSTKDWRVKKWFESTYELPVKGVEFGSKSEMN
jgi:hypothetical protein